MCHPPAQGALRSPLETSEMSALLRQRLRAYSGHPVVEVVPCQPHKAAQALGKDLSPLKGHRVEEQRLGTLSCPVSES